MHLALGSFTVTFLVDFYESVIMLLWIAAVKTGTDHEQLKISNDKQTLMSGFTMKQKSAFILLVIVPKVLLNFLWIIYGGTFVAYSASNVDLLLNSVAMTYVLDLDDLLFSCFTPATIRHGMREIPAVYIHVQRVVQIERW
eukprot:6199208-Pleurochrysis_carterae.AAC.1